MRADWLVSCHGLLLHTVHLPWVVIETRVRGIIIALVSLSFFLSLLYTSIRYLIICIRKVTQRAEVSCLFLHDTSQKSLRPAGYDNVGIGFRFHWVPSDTPMLAFFITGVIGYLKLCN